VTHIEVAPAEMADRLASRELVDACARRADRRLAESRSHYRPPRRAARRAARSSLCVMQEWDRTSSRDFAGPVPADRVRLTSTYSREDRVVHWQSALVPYGDCIEVTGTHVGLVFNRKTYRAIAATRATPELR
jgi:hypothetical protein